MADERLLDVSRHQGSIDWPKIPDVVVGALLGVTHWGGAPATRIPGELDWQAEANVEGALRRGVIPGGYQRVNPLRNSPECEAALFVSRLSYLDLFGPGRLMPAFDIEPVESGKDREGEAGISMAAWVRELFAAWMDMTGGLRVLWYSSGSFFDSKYGGLDGIPNGVSLWVAHWSGAFSNPKNLNASPELAEQFAGRTTYVGNTEHRTLIHQYWNKGTVPGVTTAVDLDCLMPGVRLAEVMQ